MGVKNYKWRLQSAIYCCSPSVQGDNLFSGLRRVSSCFEEIHSLLEKGAIRGPLVLVKERDVRVATYIDDWLMVASVAQGNPYKVVCRAYR